MTEQKRVPNEKNPVGAAILSGLFPGVGFFYIGNYVKGLAYMLIFATLIVLEVKGRGHEHVVYGLMIAAFYIFQIFDSFDEAKKTRYRDVPVEERNDEQEPVSLFISFVIVGIGVIFQMVEFGWIRMRDISKMWPLFLIGLGINFIYNYWQSNREEENNGGDNDNYYEENRENAPAGDSTQ